MSTANVVLFFRQFSSIGESKAGEPAIEENLQEKASGVETVEPFIQVDPGEDDMTTVTAFGVSGTIFTISCITLVFK